MFLVQELWALYPFRKTNPCQNIQSWMLLSNWKGCTWEPVPVNYIYKTACLTDNRQFNSTRRLYHTTCPSTHLTSFNLEDRWINLENATTLILTCGFTNLFHASLLTPTVTSVNRPNKSINFQPYQTILYLIAFLTKSN